MNGKCKTCGIETEDELYVFCSKECQWVWVNLKELNMGQYDVDKKLYLEWFEEKTIAIEAMKTREEIEVRIVEISKIEFFVKQEWAMLHRQYDKITGRKGIAPWLKEERDKLITDPNIQVNWEGDPRKKEKKPKENLLKSLLGIDIGDLTKELKDKAKLDKADKANGTKEKPIDMGDAISQLINAAPVPKAPINKASDEDIQTKAAQLKEKMRLAKEGKK